MLFSTVHNAFDMRLQTPKSPDVITVTENVIYRYLYIDTNILIFRSAIFCDGSSWRILETERKQPAILKCQFRTTGRSPKWKNPPVSALSSTGWIPALQEIIHREKSKAKNRSCVIESATGQPTDRDRLRGGQAATKCNERNPHKIVIASAAGRPRQSITKKPTIVTASAAGRPL